jgi:caffeoyl-CoA O-methyltransferase
MTTIVNPDIEAYLRGLYDDGDPVRRDMEALAAERRFPIVGPLVGRDLLLLARAIGARKIFELGSGFGYSAFFFAQAVGPLGSVHCTDLSEENERLAQEFLTRAGVWSRITYHRE